MLNKVKFAEKYYGQKEIAQIHFLSAIGGNKDIYKLPIVRAYLSGI